MKLEQNYIGYAERCILTYDPVNVEPGEVIYSVGKHWTTGDALEVVGSVCENVTGNYKTVFICEKVTGHKVEYEKLDEDNEDNEEYKKEMYSFGISDGCEDEEEIIIENVHFKVLKIEEVGNYGGYDEEYVPGVRYIHLEMI